MSLSLTFDRTDDVSKFEGSNTRGLEYRWDIFKRHLARFPAGSAVLDFGAGSLRESHDLVTRGFDVVSVDLDEQTIQTYKSMYQWPEGASHRIITAQNFTDALAKLGNLSFSFITSFDVLEHLDDPASALKAIAPRLEDDGLVFISVPNGRTLFELAFRVDLRLAQLTGRYLPPGAPHLQRNSPSKWRRVFSAAGFEVVDHELHIGFFANNGAALIQLPLAIGGRLARKAGLNFDGLAIAARTIKRAAPFLDKLDRRTQFLRPLYGWNLFVLRKATV